MTWTITYDDSCTSANKDTKPIMAVEVDVNGTGKPNCATGERPDKYKFDVYYNGRVELNSSYDSYAMARTFLETSLNNKKKNY